MSQRTHLGICMVAQDMMHTMTAFDLATLVGYEIAKGRQVTLNCSPSSVLADARQTGMKEVIEAGADWVLCIDSDMRFPRDTAERLMAHGERVVSVNCSKRKRPIGPTARRHGGEDGAIFPDPAIRGLEQVQTVGFGVMLIKTDVLHEIEWPWFGMPWVESTQKHVGEDIYFCGRLHEAGIPVYIDHDLSWEIKHTGLYDYGMQDVLNERALVESGEWAGGAV